jgi:hypothetical protein
MDSVIVSIDETLSIPIGLHNLFNAGIYIERNIVYARVSRLVTILHFKSVCCYHIVRLRVITIL